MPIPIFYFINITYMVLFFSCIYIEFQYILSALYITMHGVVTKVFYLIPFVVVVGMCVSSPFTGCVFWFSPTEGYVNGPAYNLLYAVGLYYFCLATFNLIVHWRYTDSLIKRTLLSYCLIIFSGFGLHYLFHKTMIVYLSTLVATLIVYLSLQSPSLYINSRTHCFNHRALADLIDDCQLEGKWHCQIVISLNNYIGLRVIYGDAEISKALANVSLFLQAGRRPYVTCYMGNGCFVLFSTNYLDAASEVARFSERFEQPWAASNFDLYFSFTAFFVSSDLEKLQPLFNRDIMLSHDPTSPFMAIVHSLPAGHNELQVLTEEDIKRIKYVLNEGKVLNKALETDELEVFLQPLFSPSAHRFVSAETLVRLPDGQGGYISPESFISVAENNGSIGQLDEQVLKKTCEFIATHDFDALGIDFISVNISPIQFLDRRLPGRIISLVNSYGIDPQRLEFEITETTTINPLLLYEEMKDMHRVGFTFALDDFGTGYSNFEEIIRLPLDVIKIDKSIVDAYFDKTNDLLPVIIRMIHSIDCKVVVEGVEDEEAAADVIAMGCEYIQGYYYSRPLPASEFVDLVNRFNNADEIDMSAVPRQ